MLPVLRTRFANQWPRLFSGRWSNDEWLDEFFETPFVAHPSHAVRRGFSPSVDIVEREDRYLIHADLPGVEEKDLSITLKDGVLTISGERRRETEEGSDGCRCSERTYGAFSRSFNVEGVVDAERIGATFRNGTLTVSLPKREETRPRQIPVTVG